MKDYINFAQVEQDKAINRHSVLSTIVEFVINLIQQKEVR
jgi:hypothetical protein